MSSRPQPGHINQISTGDANRQMSEIPRLINDIDNEICTLNDAFCPMLDRLAPVMSEKQENVYVSDPELAIVTDVGRKLSALLSRLTSLRRAIEETSQRLEI